MTAEPALGARVLVDKLVMKFGGLTALDDVTVTAEPGQVTAIIGSNGSGKTTMLNLVSGFLQATGGTIMLGDRRISGLRPHEIARAGVSRTFQTPLIPRSMSTRDVVAVARYMRPRVAVLPTVARTPAFRRARADDRDEARRFLALVGLEDLADIEATQLPLASRRLVEIARALVTRPTVVLLDEPASGLERREVDHLGAVLEAVADAGTTVILVEHNFRFVMDVADQVYVLDRGRLVAAGPPAQVERDPAVIQSYLGAPVGFAGRDAAAGRADAEVAEGGARGDE